MMSKSESRKATAILSFRLLPDELDAIRSAAEMQGIGITTLARRATFSASSLSAPQYEARQPNPTKADLNKILGQLGRIASSANQIAKIANKSGSVSAPMMISDLTNELQRVRKMILQAG